MASIPTESDLRCATNISGLSILIVKGRQRSSTTGWVR